jgi:hypothetical protein
VRAKSANFRWLSGYVAIGNWSWVRSSNRSGNFLAAGTIAVLGFPFLFFATAHLTLRQAGSLDPYVYAAYVYDYSDTLARLQSSP